MKRSLNTKLRLHLEFEFSNGIFNVLQHVSPRPFIAAEYSPLTVWFSLPPNEFSHVTGHVAIHIFLLVHMKEINFEQNLRRNQKEPCKAQEYSIEPNCGGSNTKVCDHRNYTSLNVCSNRLTNTQYIHNFEKITINKYI